MKGCRPLTGQEIALISAQFQGRFALRNRALLILCEKTGFRISELLSLHVGDVYHHGRVQDWVSVPKRHMKGHTQGRTLPLHRLAKRALAAWLDDYGHAPDLVLFPSRKGRNHPLSRIQAWQALQGAARAAGLTGRIGFHSLRKTFGQRVYHALGNDLNGTREALGHRWISSTQAYLPVDEWAITAAILQG